MEKAVCSVSVAPLRAENSHKSEMVSELLYGEIVTVLETSSNFARIRMDFDGYAGWVDSKQIHAISSEELSNLKTNVFNTPYATITSPEGEILLSIGSEVPAEFPLQKSSTPEDIASTALQFLNVPYLWSGRSFFGIDCGGLVQIVYKVHGFKLPRNAQQQAEVGSVLDFIEESKPGDLAFFDDEKGNIVHVGIMLQGQKIIHAYGKVRIDDLDSSGIYNDELRKHTHKLRFVKALQ